MKIFLISKSTEVNFKMTFEITITPSQANVKPKNFLKKMLDVNYNQLIKAIKNKRITLNTKKIKEDDILKENDIIKIWDKNITLRKNNPSKILEKDIQDLKLNTLFSCNDFLILNKKRGVVVQGANHNDLSLCKHLRFLEQQNNLESHSLFHIHRLDKDTTGCLIIGNGEVNIRELNYLFQHKKITKTYHTICCGWFSKKENIIELHLKRNEPNVLPKVIVHILGKPTKLKYTVIKEFEKNGQELSLVEIELITGFMHQIRVTLHHLKHPILGDEMYYNSRVNELFKDDVQRQLLHASSIQFFWKNKNINIASNLPNDFKKIIQ